MSEWPNARYDNYVYINGHPDNRFGHGSKEFYEEEFRLYGGYDRFKDRKEFNIWRKANTPKCPVCGVPRGYSMGTGDCGCLG